jgi:hypothetical protein
MDTRMPLFLDVDGTLLPGAPSSSAAGAEVERRIRTPAVQKMVHGTVVTTPPREWAIEETVRWEPAVVTALGTLQKKVRIVFLTGWGASSLELASLWEWRSCEWLPWDRSIAEEQGKAAALDAWLTRETPRAFAWADDFAIPEAFSARQEHLLLRPAELTGLTLADVVTLSAFVEKITV